MRQFHFMVGFWGKRYRDYFVDLCLPSLLSPGNLPLLRAADGHCYFIATTREDWDAIQELPIFQRMRQHVEPKFIEITLPPEVPTADLRLKQYVADINHQETCFRLLLEAARHPEAYGSLISPDVIVSDQMVASMLKHAAAGRQLVLRPALRQVEEDVLGDLAADGLLKPAESLSRAGHDLNIPPRLAAQLGIRHLHPELAGFWSNAPVQHALPPFLMWRVLEERGFILHTFFAVPVLMDFSVVPPSHTECLSRGTFEEVYISTNYGSCERVHVITDSDEFVMLSLTPRAVNWSPPPAQGNGKLAWVRKYEQVCAMRRALKLYASGGTNKLKRDLFRLSTRWHAADIDRAWLKQERRIERMINIAIGDFYAGNPLSRGVGRVWRWLLIECPDMVMAALARPMRGVRRVYRGTRLILSRLKDGVGVRNHP